MAAAAKSPEMTASAKSPDIAALTAHFDSVVDLDNEEGGLIGYRANHIAVSKIKDREAFCVRLMLFFDKTSDLDGDVNMEAWCSQFDADQVAGDFLEYIIPEKYVASSGVWRKHENGCILLKFELDNSDGSLTRQSICKDLRDHSLADNEYEGGPGEFWIVPASELK